jgi:hypothetical protein
MLQAVTWRCQADTIPHFKKRTTDQRSCET